MAIKIAHPGGEKDSIHGDYKLVEITPESGQWVYNLVKELASFDGTGRITYGGDGKPPLAGRILLEYDVNDPSHPYAGVTDPNVT